ncbi:MAG: hypothetical protein B6229_09345 [Spirochaetaceae bacterium 4572_7]|nr:MAG: hypothetical protein B6229_09345 [Spirochaetaceae bacterium 4572_7]
MEVREYLEKKGFAFKTIQRASGINYQMNCPFCGDTEQKFYIEEGSGRYNCFHANRCGVTGNFYKFQKELGDTPKRPKKYDIHKPIPKVYKKPTETVNDLGKEVYQYLKDRKFSDETIKHFRLGQKDNRTLMIPFYKNKELVFIKYRDIFVKKKMYSTTEGEPLLFNRDNTLDDVLVICEGEMDAIAYREYGVVATSVPGGTKNLNWIENEYVWLEQFGTIFISMDNDRSGQEAVLKIVDRLGYHRCKNVILPYKDANECLIEGITKEEIEQCFIDAEEFQRDLIKRPKDIRERLKEKLFNIEKRDGVPTQFIYLTNILGGYREGELTVLGGNNHSGKSTLLNQIMLYLTRKGHSCFMASLEMKLEEYLAWAVYQTSYNGEPSLESMDALLNVLQEKLVMLDTVKIVNPEILLDYWTYSAKRYGTKFFFLDSLMRIDLEGSNEYKEQTKFVSQLVSFAQEFSCHIFMIAHMRKGDKDTYVPGKVDIAGSVNITNLAHNVFTLWRVPEDEVNEKGHNTKLYVKKCRETGRTGSIKFNFDPQAKTFKEVNNYGGF